MNHLAKSGEQVRTPYKIDTGPIPLDVIAVNQINEPGGCWYRIPSWRVHFDCEALKGVDLRLHRSIASAAVWTLTEATTGFKIFGDLAHDQYIGDEGSMLAEFAAGRMLQLTPEKVAKAIETAKEILAKRPSNPFGKSARDEIIEECARACEREADRATGDAYCQAADHCAKVLRAMR